MADRMVTVADTYGKAVDVRTDWCDIVVVGISQG